MTKLKSVLAVAISTVLLSGCATTGVNSFDFSDFDIREVFDTSQEVTDYEDRLSRGLYAAVGIGPSRLEPDASEVASYTVNDRVEAAGQITVGADITKHLSLEAHSADLGSAGFSPSGRINYHINGASALLYAGGNRDRYRRQGLNAFGRIGVGALENTPVGDVPFVKDNATHVLLGVGVEYMTPIGVGLRAEGISFDEDVKYAQLGLMYRTGRKLEIRKPKLAMAPVVKPAVQPAVQPVVAAAAPPPPPPPVYIEPVAEVMPEPNRCAGIEGVLEGVGFHSDSASLTTESSLILDEVAYTLSTCVEVAVDVEAHTDAIGSESYNQELSERRAQSVVDYLSAQGLDSYRLRPNAFGESSPIDSNETADGRARNRRVEIYAR